MYNRLKIKKLLAAALLSCLALVSHGQQVTAAYKAKKLEATDTLKLKTIRITDILPQSPLTLAGNRVLATKSYLDSNIVHLVGNENILGKKKFFDTTWLYANELRIGTPTTGNTIRLAGAGGIGDHWKGRWYMGYYSSMYFGDYCNYADFSLNGGAYPNMRLTTGPSPASNKGVSIGKGVASGSLEGILDIGTSGSNANSAIPPIHFTGPGILLDSNRKYAIEIWNDSIYYTGSSQVRKRLATINDLLSFGGGGVKDTTYVTDTSIIAVNFGTRDTLVIKKQLPNKFWGSNPSGAALGAITARNIVAADIPFARQVSDTVTTSATATPTFFQLKKSKDSLSALMRLLADTVTSSPTATPTFYQLKKSKDSLQSVLPRRIVSSNVQINNTGNTTENTIFTGTIPANSIGPNGSYHINGLFSYTSSTNSKAIRIKFNGTTVATVSVSATGVITSSQSVIFNRNSLSAQIGMNASNNVTVGGPSSTGATTYTINTAADITVTVTAQLGLGTETASMEAFEITGYY